MNVEARARYGVELRPSGPNSSYRLLGSPGDWPSRYGTQWYFWVAHQHGGALAAYPGTSNHGWATAVDLATQQMRSIVDQIGAKYGWKKTEAFSEWWHMNYVGGFTGKDPGPDGHGAGPSYPTLKPGSKGDEVKRAQKALRRWNWGITRPDKDGDFGGKTAQAVQEFQITHGLKPADGIVGPKTWKALRRKDPLYRSERLRINRLRLARYGDVRDHEEHDVDIWKTWCAKRARAIQAAAQKDGWDKDHRRQRFTILKNAAPEAFDSQPH